MSRRAAGGVHSRSLTVSNAAIQPMHSTRCLLLSGLRTGTADVSLHAVLTDDACLLRIITVQERAKVLQQLDGAYKVQRPGSEELQGLQSGIVNIGRKQPPQASPACLLNCAVP